MLRVSAHFWKTKFKVFKVIFASFKQFFKVEITFFKVGVCNMQHKIYKMDLEIIFLEYNDFGLSFLGTLFLTFKNNSLF